jgi:hypothetical protein
MPKRNARAGFIEPMLLMRTEKLPEGAEWLIELKLDGYRALAIKSGGKVQLRSRNDNDFNLRYAADQVVNEGFNLGIEVGRGSAGGIDLRFRDLLFGELRNLWHFLHSPFGKYRTLWCLLPFREYGD